MKVLGIDPGTRVVGYAIVDSCDRHLAARTYGAIQAKNKSLPERLSHIYHELTKIITAFEPQQVAIEKVFYGKKF